MKLLYKFHMVNYYLFNLFSLFKVLEQYKNIMRRLNEKPDTIERIFEIRDWIETIPMSLRSLDEMTRKYVLVGII